MIVIGISGKAEHGKTFLANLLKPKLEAKGYKVVIQPLAQVMKEQAKMLGWARKTNADADSYKLSQILSRNIMVKNAMLNGHMKELLTKRPTSCLLMMCVCIQKSITLKN